MQIMCWATNVYLNICHSTCWTLLNRIGLDYIPFNKLPLVERRQPIVFEFGVMRQAGKIQHGHWRYGCIQVVLFESYCIFLRSDGIVLLMLVSWCVIIGTTSWTSSSMKSHPCKGNFCNLKHPGFRNPSPRFPLFSPFFFFLTSHLQLNTLRATTLAAQRNSNISLFSVSMFRPKIFVAQQKWNRSI